MKATRNGILAGMILLATVLFVPGTTWAKATETAVTGTTLVTPSGLDPKGEWIDDEGIYHLRGEQADYVFIGDLTGTGVGVVNINLDLATGNGDESGYSSSQLTWGELTGTFEGHFSVTYTGWVGIGHGVYHGTGDFTGMKLMEDFVVVLYVGPPYVVTYEGIILDPHGK